MPNPKQQFWFWFALGALIGGLLLVFNVLSEERIDIPLLTLYVGDFHLHHFFIGLPLLFVGFFLVKSRRLGAFLLGLGFVLVIDDLQDLVAWIRVGNTP